MSFSRWHGLWAALAIAWTFAAQSAEPERWSPIADTVFQHLTKENGLPDIVVTALEEDGDGFLWVGTQGGLARWDGYRFRTYLPDRNDPGSLPAEWVQSLHRDAAGRLWVGTAAGGMARYDRDHDRFVPVPVGPNGTSHASVEAIIDDGSGGLWVATDDGLDHLDSNGAALAHLRHEAGNGASLPDNKVYALLTDQSGALWAGTAAGVVRQTDEGGFIAVTSSDTRALFQDSAGRLWIGTRNQGAYILPPGATVAQPAIDPATQPGLEKSWIVSIVEAGPGEIWLGTHSQGIVAVNRTSGRIEDLRHDDKRASSLADDTIFALYRDRAGLLWVGSYRGLSRHDSAPAIILPLFGNSDRANGVSDRDVRSVLTLADGRILLGFGAAGGVDLFDARKGRLKALRPAPDRPEEALPADVVSSAAEAPDGTIYIGTFRGLYRMDRDGRKIARVKIAGRGEDGGVQCLFLDEHGLWIGGREDGVWRIDPATGTVREHIGGDRLTDARIRIVSAGHPGEMWIATVKGVNRLDLATGTIEHILPDASDPQSLSAEFTDSLLLDGEDRLWIATARGIDVMEGRDAQGRPRFHQISTAQGLPHNIVYMLLPDRNGDIWASTESGLALVDHRTFAVRALGQAEGIPFPEGFWSSSGDKTAEGEILFGALGGLAVIRPEMVKSWDYQPAVAATDIRIGGSALQGGQIAGGAHPLTILPQGNSLVVEFSALDYSAPDRNRYAYWLEGFDKSWIDTDWTRRLASYTNLPPGKYTLHLRGTNRDGLWSDKTLALPVRVMPIWYQTLWFKILAVMTAFLAIALLVRSRTAYLQHRQVMLEEQVTERTAALREKSEQVTNLLDNSGQGFLSLGADLVVSAEYSAACEVMLGGSPAGRAADQVLFGHDPHQAELFRLGVPGLLAEEAPHKQSMILSFLPERIEREEQILKVDYKRLDAAQLMVVLTDITEERRLADQIEREHMRLGMIVAAVTDSTDFLGAVEAYRSFATEGYRGLLAMQAAPPEVLSELSRQVHTFKGLLSQLNFAESPQALHLLEEKLASLEPPSLEAIEVLLAETPLAALIERDLDVLRDALGEEFLHLGRSLILTPEQMVRLEDMAAKLLRGESVDAGMAGIRALAEEICNLRRLSLHNALSGYDRVIAQAAAQTGKLVNPLTIQGGEDLWIDPKTHGPFLRSLVHVFRNAVAHGIEEPAIRIKARKNQAGTITCHLASQETTLRLAISDDGGGLDFEALRAKAVKLRLYSESQAAGLSDQEIADLVFRDRVSSREQSDELAGRGIGLAAVAAEIRALGGSFAVESKRGAGTRFVFDLPRR